MKRTTLFFVFFILAISSAFSRGKSDFVLWQLPSQINTIGNSYVFHMKDGKVAVMDGGVKQEAPYLRGFIAALGNKVDIWFVSHPHPDHIGALTEILKDPKGMKIVKVCQSAFSFEFCNSEPDYREAAEEFYEALNRSGIPVINITEPGYTIRIDKTFFRILSTKHEEITVNQYNNSSMVIRAWDKSKSILFLGDCGREEGDLLLNSPLRKELNCDYLQMAHHGQKGVSKDFYRTIKFKACLWPSPSWVYNNDAGKGFNTHTFETVEIRNLVDSLGIKKNYVSCEGLFKIE